MTEFRPSVARAAEPAAPDRISTIGLAALMRLAYRGDDFAPIWQRLAERAYRDPTDAAALMDLSTILQLTGQRERGLQLQQTALRLSPLYRRAYGSGAGPKLLALVVAGDFMANTPLDFLLDGSDCELHLLYVQPDRPLPAQLPPHEVCFLAIGESRANRPILAALAPVLANWRTPVVNGAPARIAALSRDGVAAMFAADADVVVAPTVRCQRQALTAWSKGRAPAPLPPGIGFPLLARPLDSHAGEGLCKLDDAGCVRAYLHEQTESEFYLAPFIDYRSADGLFRKQRIAFIGGEAFLSHMAVSEHWMVHYLSAGMEASAEKRAEEARLFAQFETGFAGRHRAAFASLQRRIGLDYFAIDCAELRDGRLLLFEADVAMIVHSLDPPELFPYKQAAMARLFGAFQTRLAAAACRPGLLAAD